jgi:hypothetical protein
MHDARTTDELISAHARECLRRSAEPGDAWVSRAKDILERDTLVLQPERDLQDGAYCMEFADLIRRCRREQRVAYE